MGKQVLSCVLLIVVIMVPVSICSPLADTCTSRFMDLSLLVHRAQQIPNEKSQGYPLDNTIRLLNDVQFTCATSITSISLGLDILTNENSSRYAFPAIQVWKPSSFVARSYNLLTEQTIYYTTDNVSTNGVYNYPLNPPLSVDIGYLIALKQPQMAASVVRIYYTVLGNTIYRTTAFDVDRESINLSGAGAGKVLWGNQIVLAFPKTGDDSCITVNNGPISADVVEENALLLTTVVTKLREQHVYPDMRFSCNGTISKWIYGAEVSSGTVQPELQIWRQTGPDTYTKQGFSSVPANETASPNVHEYYPETTLQFQEGDMLGVYYPNDVDASPVMYMQENSGPQNVIIAEVSGPLSEVSGAISRKSNDYPLVSLVIEVYATHSATTLSTASTITSMLSKSSIASTPSKSSPIASTSSKSSSTQIDPTMEASTTNHVVSSTTSTSTTPIISATSTESVPRSSNTIVFIVVATVLVSLGITIAVAVMLIIIFYLKKRKCDTEIVTDQNPSYHGHLHSHRNPAYGINECKALDGSYIYAEPQCYLEPQTKGTHAIEHEYHYIDCI